MNEPVDDPSRSDPTFRTSRLVRELRAGQRERFDELYARVAPGLVAWAMLRVRPGMRAWLDPQDVAQEVWLRAVRGFEAYDERGSFRAWITGIAKNVLLEGMKKLRGLPLVDGGGSTRVFLFEGCPEDVAGVSAQLARDESVLRLVEFAEASSPEDRRILIHCGLEELTCAETAVLLGMSEAAVMKRWQRLRAKLREVGWAQRLFSEGSA